MVQSRDVGALADGDFRRESARLVASLTRVFGPGNIHLVEDVVQEALETALQAWQVQIPDNPAAWLSKVARNRALDVIRHQNTQRKYAEEHESQLGSGWSRSTTIDDSLAEEAADENQLRMMFSLCHHELSADTHVTLILKFLCGFGTRELALAYFVPEDTIKKRLARGRTKFRELGALVPVTTQHGQSLLSVLNALYLLFSEGFHGSHATSPTRAVLCQEALRPCDLVIRTTKPPHPQAHALMALMYFHIARINGRFDKSGEVIPLASQDRSTWDKTAIVRGVEPMGLSAAGEELSSYHIESGIACKHCLVASFEETDWIGILDLYDLLFDINPNPLIEVIRATVRAHAGDPQMAAAEVESLEHEPTFQTYPFYWAARGEIHALNGDTDTARIEFEKAATLARNRIESSGWQRRASELRELQVRHPELGL